MSHTALIQLKPLVTPDAWDAIKAGGQPGERYAMRGALKLLPKREGVPVLLDHTADRRVGVVEKLYELDTLDGPFLFACAKVDRAPPWLRKGTRASISYFRFQWSDAGWLADGFVKEVSILSDAHEPREPLARVVSLEERPASPKPAGREPAGHVSYGGEVIRRRTGSVLAVGGVPLNPPTRTIGRTRTQGHVFTNDEIADRIAAAEATGIPGAVERELEHMRRLEAAALRVA